MIEHPSAGPMFDPEDGTVGRIQLIRRWALTSQRMVWPQPRAAFMYDDPLYAEEHLALLRETERLTPNDIEVAMWWCWPTSRCPAYLVTKEGV
jgi:hypothetical protein